MNGLLTRAVLRNMTALYLFQVLNYVIPLVMVPYLVRILGMETFGVLMFVTAFIIFGRVWVAFGFDMTATRQVAIVGLQGQEQISHLLADVILVRLALGAIFAAACLSLFFLVTPFQPMLGLLLFGILLLLGEALFPVWLFQGLERMAPLVLIRACVRLLHLAVVLTFVRGPEDAWMVPASEALAISCGSLGALIYAAFRLGLRPVRPSPARMLILARSGTAVFVATLSAQFYTTVNMIILGLVVGPVSVGAYSIAERVYSAVRGLLGPFVQSTFPALSRNFERDVALFEAQYHRTLVSLFFILTGVAVVLGALSAPIIRLFAGAGQGEATTTLLVFACAMPFALGGFLSPMLVSRGRDRTLMRITILGGVIGLLLCPPLAAALDAPGAAFAFLIVQVYNSVALHLANGRAAPLART